MTISELFSPVERGGVIANGEAWRPFRIEIRGVDEVAPGGHERIEQLQ